MTKIAILGAGHGGHAMIADLSMAGYEVSLYEIPEFYENIKPIIENGGVQLIARRPPNEEIQLPAGGVSGFARITGKVSSNIQEVIYDAEIIMVVVPAFGRERFLTEAAPHLTDGQKIVIWPGYFGALQCKALLNNLGINKDILISETESLIYTCEKRGPALVNVKDFKRKIAISALPASRTDEVVKLLKPIFPPIVPAKNVFETTLANVNPPLHPTSVILNLFRIETQFFPYYEETGGLQYRCYDLTPGMANVMNAIDKEQRDVAKNLGLTLMSLKETLTAFYQATGNNLYETMLNVPPYQKQGPPTSILHRYVTEDVPYALVPYALLGEQLGVETPTIRALATIASVECGIDFWESGLTLEKLHLAGMRADKMIEYVTKE